MKISGCLIVKNEEKNIFKCIHALKSITDEIIVVDTGSTDATARIARELGARVYEHRWENDFSKAKNYALGYATGDWIIFPDADERFSEESLPLVRPAIHKADLTPEKDGIICKLHNIDEGSLQLMGVGKLLRIFRNRATIRFVNPIHEEIRKDNKPLNCWIFNELTILHTGYSTAIINEKAKRNLELLQSNPTVEKAAYYLASTYSILDDPANAAKYADIAISDPVIARQAELCYKMYQMKINSILQMESPDMEDVRETVAEAMKKFPTHPEIVAAEANYHAKMKNYSAALAQFRYALECNETYSDHMMYNDFPSYIHEVYYNMGVYLCLFNREADALEYYVKALRVNKYHAASLKSLLMLMREVPEAEVIVFLNGIYQIKNEDDVRFIVAQASDCGRPKIVLYYVSIWNNTFGHEDDTLIYALIAQRNYSQAFQVALLYRRTDAKYVPVLACAVIMGELWAEVEQYQDDIGKEYCDVITHYAKRSVYPSGANACAIIFSALVKFADQFDVSEFVCLAPLWTPSEWEIGEAFLSNMRFEQAAQWFEGLYERQTAEGKMALAAYKSGFCRYRLRQYHRSVQWLEKAVTNGYDQNDLPECLKSMLDQQTDAEIKAAANRLLSAFHGRTNGACG